MEIPEIQQTKYKTSCWLDPFEKYQPKWESSPNRGEHKIYISNHHTEEYKNCQELSSIFTGRKRKSRYAKKSLMSTSSAMPHFLIFILLVKLNPWWTTRKPVAPNGGVTFLLISLLLPRRWAVTSRSL